MSSIGLALQYFGVYIAVFGGLYFITAALDKCKFMDKLVSTLSDAAYASLREELLADPVTKKELENLEKKEDKGFMEKCCECNSGSCSCCFCFGTKGAQITPEGVPPAAKKYHRSFRVALLKKRLYWNLKVSDLDAAGGSCLYYFISCCCFGSDKLVDKLYFLINNHTIIGMCGAEKEHPTSRAEKRMDYFIQHALALMFSCFIANGSFDYGTVFILNVVICTPAIQVTKFIFYYLTSCPCLEFHSENCCVTKIQACLIYIGESMGKLMAVACIAIYFIAGMFSYQTGDYSNLARYCYQIFIISQTQELIFAYMKFTDRWYQIKIFKCIPVLQMGDWYLEKMKHQKIDVTADDNKTCVGIPCFFQIWYSKDELKTNYEIAGKTTPEVATPVGDVDPEGQKDVEMTPTGHDAGGERIER